METDLATLLIVGAGSRGTGYAEYALEHPDEAKVVGVAEPRDEARRRLASAHDIPSDRVVRDWREMAELPKCADAVVIATQDAMHEEPAVAFARKGYGILLEKPMAPDEGSCRRIVDAVQDAEVLFAVCHVLRYTRYTRALKKLIDDGVIGDVVNVQRLEPVGYWHQAHSFVRGNWRNEAESSSMLLAKCCHDIDWIRHIMGSRCTSIQSFGTLKHFRPGQQPPGAAERCVDCSCESTCPYSARRIYEGRLRQGQTGWPVDIVTDNPTEESLAEALRTGPYGRCVYACDNDVVDNQVVNMAFEGGQTASLTMTAFTEGNHRQTRVFGTRGELTGNGRTIRHFDFLSDHWEEIDTQAGDGSILGGHGGGDEMLMEAFVDAVRHGDPSRILSGPRETLETHLMTFAAEQARTGHRVVDLVV